MQSSDTSDLPIGALRSFIAVAELGSITQAAAAVGRSQSAVSTQMTRLEEITGRRLLAADGRGRRLTEAGLAFRVLARGLVAAHDDALAAMRSRSAGRVLKVGAMDDYAARILPPLVSEFQATREDARVEVVAGFSDGLMRRLGRDLDLVLSTHPIGMGRGRVLRREQARWAFAEGVPLPTDEAIPLALQPEGNLFRAWAIHALEVAGLRYRIAFTGNSVASVEAACAAGLAYCVVKEGSVPAHVRLIPVGRLPELPMAEIVVNKTAQNRWEAADAFEALLLDRLGGQASDAKEKAHG